MTWKKFNVLDTEFPEAIVQRRISGFENATEGLAALSIKRLGEFGRLTTDLRGEFKFELVLHSQHLKHFKFVVLSFGYDVTLLPIYLVVEDSIYQEIYGETLFDIKTQKIDSIEDFDHILKTIFDSKSFELVVSGLMKVSSKGAD